MIQRFSQLPASIAALAKTVRLGPAQVPALLIHPDWSSTRPVVIWHHGRTAYKELDPGRYQRWIRAGFAACAVDLPGHGERADEAMQSSDHTLRVVRQAVGEVDSIVSALADADWKNVFDAQRLGIGGMSMGGMVTLRRLCDPHPFRAAAVEGTTGSLTTLSTYKDRHGEELLNAMDAIQHLGSWRPIPLLALHSEKDAWVPVAGIREFTLQLAERYRSQGADPAWVTLKTWPETGAPQEHLGFGKVSNEAKNTQTSFFQEHLGAGQV